MNKCEKCEKIFKRKSQLQCHINRKFPCVKTEDIINRYQEEINKIDKTIDDLTTLSITSVTICKFCIKTYSKKSNLDRHLLFCNKKQQLIKNKENLIDKIKVYELETKTNKINELQGALKKLKNKNTIPIQNVTNNITNNNVTNNIQNNIIININSFGNETIDHITLQDYKKYLNGFFKGFLNYIEKVHFDDNVPENHNICIPNIKSKNMYVYENNDWILKEKNEIIDNLVTNKFNLLTNKYDELEEAGQINSKTIDNFEEFKYNYKDEEAQKNTKKDVSLLVYNNKEKVNIKKD
jgi:hypothetical protein